MCLGPCPSHFSYVNPAWVSWSNSTLSGPEHSISTKIVGSLSSLSRLDGIADSSLLFPRENKENIVFGHFRREVFYRTTCLECASEAQTCDTSWNSCYCSLCSFCKMGVFQGAPLLAVLLVLCNLSVLAEGKKDSDQYFKRNFCLKVQLEVKMKVFGCALESIW